MDFDNGDLDDGIAGLDGFSQVLQIPQPHTLINSVQDSHIRSGESIVSFAPSLQQLTRDRS